MIPFTKHHTRTDQTIALWRNKDEANEGVDGIGERGRGLVKRWSTSISIGYTNCIHLTLTIWFTHTSHTHTHKYISSPL